MRKNCNSSTPIETPTITLRSESKSFNPFTGKQQETELIIVSVTSIPEENLKNSSTKPLTGSTVAYKMSSQDLSREFSKYHFEIETYAKKLINYLGKPIDSAWILSECYIYLHANLDAIDTTKTMISYSKNWIKSNIKWTNSPLNRQIRLNNLSESQNISGSSGIYLFDSDDISNQIQDFRDNLSTYDRRLFHIYYDLDLRKGKDIADHLDISISSSYPIIKQAKQLECKLRAHLKSNNIF